LLTGSSPNAIKPHQGLSRPTLFPVQVPPAERDECLVLSVTNSISVVLSLLVARTRNERGQTMAEYGILIALIALVVVVVAVTLGGAIASVFGSTSNNV
jgi:pilus assembly protein Flp/PilA